MLGEKRAGERHLSRASLLGCVVLAITAALAGCGQGSGAAPESNNRGGVVATTPDVDGTYIGSATFTESGNKFRLMFDLDQDDAALSGSANVVSEAALFPLPALEGEARPSREISLSDEYRDDGGEARWTFEGEVRGADTISGEVTAVDSGGDEDKGSFEARRLDTTDAADMALATVQAIYDRNAVFLAEHGHYEWRQNVGEQYGGSEESEEVESALGDEFAANIYAQFYDEGGDNLDAGVGIEADEESFVFSEQPPLIFSEFQYTRSDGGAGKAVVTLIESGADAESAGYQVLEIELDYPTEDDFETLFLGV